MIIVTKKGNLYRLQFPGNKMVELEQNQLNNLAAVIDKHRTNRVKEHKGLGNYAIVETPNGICIEAK